MRSKQAVLSFLKSTVLPFLVLGLARPILAEVPQGWPADPLEMTPRAGVLGFEEKNLFQAWPFFSEGHIVAGTTAVSKLDANGNKVMVGSLIIAWSEGDEPRSSRGAFVIRVSPSGKRLGEAYFGALPNGEAASNYGLQALAVADDRIAVGGWVGPTGSEGSGDRDFFVAQLSADLLTTYWTSSRPALGHGEVHDLFFDTEKDVLVSGSVAGKDFIGLFDALTGRGVESLTKKAPSAISPIGPIAVEPVTAETHPDDVEILMGNNSSCDDSGSGDEDECVARVAASDDNDAWVTSIPQAGEQGGDLIQFAFSYPIPPKKPKLTAVSFEIQSDDCVEVRVSLTSSNNADGMPLALAPMQSCEQEEKFTFEVPESVARALGFWSSRPPADLISHVEIEIFSGGPKCSGCLGGTAAGVDESTASSEIADP